jgi:hypothetical protein
MSKCFHFHKTAYCTLRSRISSAGTISAEEGNSLRTILLISSIEVTPALLVAVFAEIKQKIPPPEKLSKNRDFIRFFMLALPMILQDLLTQAPFYCSKSTTYAYISPLLTTLVSIG